MLLRKAYQQAGESTLVDLCLDKKTIPVLFYATDTDPLTGELIHVDFYAVDMKKEVEASVSLNFKGESPAVRDLGGILVTPLDHVTVRCLPLHLPSEISVDISSLETFGVSITIADLQLPQSVEVLESPDATVVMVQEPRAQEEEEKPAEEGIAEGEVAAGTDEKKDASSNAKEESFSPNS